MTLINTNSNKRSENDFRLSNMSIDQSQSHNSYRVLPLLRVCPPITE